MSCNQISKIPSVDTILQQANYINMKNDVSFLKLHSQNRVGEPVCTALYSWLKTTVREFLCAIMQLAVFAFQGTINSSLYLCFAVTCGVIVFQSVRSRILIQCALNSKQRRTKTHYYAGRLSKDRSVIVRNTVQFLRSMAILHQWTVIEYL